MKLTIIIPCYNEERTVQDAIGQVVYAELPQGWEREVLVIDDGSKDKTVEILQSLTATFPFRLTVHSQNQGKGGAIRTALAQATGDYILIQDADLEYSTKDYVALLSPIITGKAEAVFGSRTLGKNNVSYKFVYYWGGMLSTKVFNVLYRTKFTDVATCYKLFPSRVKMQLAKYRSNDFVFDVVEMTIAIIRSCKVIEVPISYVPRSIIAGKKLNWRHGMRVVLAMFRERIYLLFKKGAYA